jgi:hypothetical protein
MEPSRSEEQDLARLPPPDPRLVERIRDRSIRDRVTQISRFAVAALEDLQHLDDSLYEHFMSGSGAFGGGQAPADVLQEVIERTFRGLRQLLTLGLRLAPADEAPTTLPDDLDFGDLEKGSSTDGGTGADFKLGAEDIGDLLGGIDEQTQTSEPELFRTLLERMSSIEYGLRNQLDDLTRASRAPSRAGTCSRRWRCSTTPRPRPARASMRCSR